MLDILLKWFVLVKLVKVLWVYQPLCGRYCTDLFLVSLGNWPVIKADTYFTQLIVSSVNNWPVIKSDTMC